eukprot:2746839-Amphidinium_carterae.1
MGVGCTLGWVLRLSFGTVCVWPSSLCSLTSAVTIPLCIVCGTSPSFIAEAGWSGGVAAALRLGDVVYGVWAVLWVWWLLSW